jgi:hypothetical protein
MRLHELMRELADDAPSVTVPAGLFDKARRRRRQRWSAVAAAVVVALFGGYVLSPLPGVQRFGGSTGQGLPDRIVVPPWWTATVKQSPPGAASVVLTGNTPQGDHEDAKVEFWRDGYTAEPSTVVGLSRDTYRVARGAYIVGVELSPDGRYLVWNRDHASIVSAEVLDLTSGRISSLTNITSGGVCGWSTDGRWLLMIHRGTALVVSWPSQSIVWSVHYDDPAAHSPDYCPPRLSLSPDGSMLAVQTADELRVYRHDGTLLWKHSAGDDNLAGRASWLGDGRLALLRRSDVTCPACPEHESPYPSTWSLILVDGSTGSPVDTPAYPAVRAALGVRLVAWRGDAAYAVVQSAGAHARVGVVRLGPGGATATEVLTAPAGTGDLNVATDYVDYIRGAGPPQNGMNVPEVLARSSCLIVPVIAALLLMVWLRLRRRHTSSEFV